MSLIFHNAAQQSSPLSACLSDKGYAFVPSQAMRAGLEARGLRDWEAFAASWDDLEIDGYMADGGRYRRRRHAVFEVLGGRIERLPDRPHFQTLAHNPLNGGIARLFAPMKPEIGGHPALTAILTSCNDIFSTRDGGQKSVHWELEAHQFRIEASDLSAGKPAPEGIHRDGVDFVFIMLVRRANIIGGETMLLDEKGCQAARRTLAMPFDAVFLDDAKVVHGTTEIERLEEGHPSFRDALVVTFRMI